MTLGNILHVGDRLGPFVLEKQIAIGGMAEVWAASKPGGSPGRARGNRFALKVLREVFTGDAALRDMFLDEARIAERLRHPNIVEVEGAYNDREWLFQAMELLDGKDLRRVLAAAVKAKATLPIPLVILITRDVARALGYAHAARADDGQPLEIVHRDVSPHNVMLCADGWVKVLDFGIARAKERLTRTAAGVIKGKLAYMAPEQALGEALSPRTDVYALGIVLWEMLAMRRLFKGTTDAEIIAAVCESKIPPIREINRDVPPELAELIGAMLAQRPRHRPESMRVAEDGLSRVLFRYYSEEEASLDALSTWVRPFVGEPRRKTAVMPAAEVPPATAPEPGRRTPSRASGSTDGMDELSEEKAPIHQTNREHPIDATVPTPMIPALPVRADWSSTPAEGTTVMATESNPRASVDTLGMELPTAEASSALSALLDTAGSATLTPQGYSRDTAHDATLAGHTRAPETGTPSPAIRVLEAISLPPKVDLEDTEREPGEVGDFDALRKSLQEEPPTAVGPTSGVVTVGIDITPYEYVPPDPTVPITAMQNAKTLEDPKPPQRMRTPASPAPSPPSAPIAASPPTGDRTISVPPKVPAPKAALTPPEPPTLPRSAVFALITLLLLLAGVAAVLLGRG